jgi:hypothetical protein
MAEQQVASWTQAIGVPPSVLAGGPMGASPHTARHVELSGTQVAAPFRQSRHALDGVHAARHVASCAGQAHRHPT